MIEKVTRIVSEFTEIKSKQMTHDTKLAADIEIPDRIIKDFQTVGNIINYLECHV